MTKQDLIQKIVDVTGLTKKTVTEMISGLFSAIAPGVVRKSILEGFGRFKDSKRDAITGVNTVSTSSKIKIPAGMKITFKAGKGAAAGDEASEVNEE